MATLSTQPIVLRNSNSFEAPSLRSPDESSSVSHCEVACRSEEGQVSERHALHQTGGDDLRRDSAHTRKLRALTKMGVFSQVKKCEDRWTKSVRNFAVKTEEKRESIKMENRTTSVTSMTSEKRKKWMKALLLESYRRQHPRRVILDFFNDVAQEGAHNVEETGKIESKECLHPLLRYFNRASVFTVWRPTSMDAMIKMIRHEAVGKGLDIKAKSALKGKLSGFVPFLQISNNLDKKPIMNIPKNGMVRLYFKRDEPEEAEMVRSLAVGMLEHVADEILNMKYVERLSVALRNSSDKSSRTAILEQLNELNTKSRDLRGYSIQLIDDFAPICYGLEIPMLLFWEAFIVRQDISREPGSPFDMGRESCCRGQNANIKSALYNQAPEHEGDHRVVILQTAGLSCPMNPFELLMAYESSEGRKEILPVVSDCDCFLVGTRRVTYKTPMDPDQVNTMKWNVSGIKKIMETPEKGDRWGKRWSEVLEEASSRGFKPKIPEIGFGDPKSCSIMANVVDRLGGSGGVRHGAECFNYYIPQDLPDEFVIVADGLPGGIPWMKVNQEELHDFLDEKINLSFTFPLNPKWILYDGGRWREHYDKLMAHDNENTQDSMNIWFPKDSGIREEIDSLRFNEGLR